MLESWNFLSFTKRKRDLSRYFNKFDDENKRESKSEAKGIVFNWNLLTYII